MNGVTPPGTLSPIDKQWALKWYPGMPKSLPALHAFKPAVLSLAAGKQADLVVVQGDPSTRITDVENVRYVFKAGVAFDPAKLIDSVRDAVGIH